MSALKYRRAPTDEVELYWRIPDELTIQATRALYMFRKKNGRAILYIGKAARQTVRGRLMCRSKDRLIELAGKDGRVVRPFLAGLFTTRRQTPKLIDDVERLLIFLIRPGWNGPGRKTCRLHHRSLVVVCSGEWPHPRTRFEYHDSLPSFQHYTSE